MAASWPSVRMSSRPSASVATIGFPAASASNAVSGVPSQSEGNTVDVECRERARGVAAKAGEDEAIPEPEARGLRLEIRAQRPFADEHESGAGPRGDDPRRGVHEERVAFRLVQPGDGADGELVRGEAELVARRGDLIARFEDG